MATHYIREHVGFGNNGSLPELRKCLAHYLDRPKTYHNNQRAQRSIMRLQRQIAEIEQANR